MSNATLTRSVGSQTESASADGPEGRSRLAGLNGYRGLAALAVVVYHVFQSAAVGSPGAFTSVPAVQAIIDGLDGAVDMFFVLSAFLLTVPFARAVLHGRPGPSTRAFAVRRAARIVPLYLVAILAVWAWRNPTLPGDLLDLLQHATFTQIYDDQRIFWTIGPAWSLAVEIHFYIVLALIGAVLAALGGRLAQPLRLPLLLGSIGLLFVGSVLFKAVVWYVMDVPGDRWSVWFSLPAKLDVFALGMLLAVAYAATSRRIATRPAALVRWTGAALVIVALATRSQANEHLWFHTIVGIGFTAILAATVLRATPGRTERALDGVVPATLGLISYSLYIWHEPLLLWLASAGIVPDGHGTAALLPTLVVLVPAAIGIAWLSYHVIEVPGNQLRRLVNSHGRSRHYYDEIDLPDAPDMSGATEPR
jgi:peptidoglycan/LPS O-acetylase OafA/YrhL